MCATSGVGEELDLQPVKINCTKHVKEITLNPQGAEMVSGMIYEPYEQG